MKNQTIKGIALLILGPFLLIGFIYFARQGSLSALSLKEIILNFLWLVWILSVIAVGIGMLTDKKLFLFEQLSLFSFVLMLIYIIVCWRDLGAKETTELGIYFNWIYLSCMIVALFLVLEDYFRMRGKEIAITQKQVNP